MTRPPFTPGVELPLIGAIDQFVDSTDVLASSPVYRRLVGAFRSY